jgi:hypothetical protein
VEPTLIVEQVSQSILDLFLRKVGHLLFWEQCTRIFLAFHLPCPQVGLLQQAALDKTLPSKIKGARQLFQLGCPHLRQLFQLGCSIRTNVIILVILELIPYFFQTSWERGRRYIIPTKRLRDGARQHHYGHKISSAGCSLIHKSAESELGINEAGGPA